jgi:hypothetical protein
MMKGDYIAGLSKISNQLKDYNVKQAYFKKAYAKTSCNPGTQFSLHCSH